MVPLPRSTLSPYAKKEHGHETQISLLACPWYLDNVFLFGHSSKTYSLDKSVTTCDPVPTAINDLGHLEYVQGVIVVAVEIANCDNTVAAAVVVGSMGSVVVEWTGVNGILDEVETE